MIRLFVLSIFVLAVNGDYCYNDVVQSCGAIGGAIGNCNSNYSAVHTVQPDLQHYTATHIDQNFQFLLMSAYFNNYEANREGFSKLYRQMADDAWEDTIDLIKYMAKRGFNMNYNIVPRKKVKIQSYKMYELSSLATALDMQKVLAEQAHEIHSEVTVRKKRYHDAETINFIEKEFVGKHADRIRDLAGHANDLHQLIADNKDPSLAIYLFDEHLKKVLA
uniref:Ferritin n=1 Tax=Cuerna arida TaxID=1464854 RepID=A0A1B6GR05_9HEMI